MISCSEYFIQRIYIFLNKVSLRDQKCHICDEKCHQCCITRFIPLYLIIYPVINKSRSWYSSARLFLFYATVLFYLRLNSYISNLYNPNQNSSLASQTICDHMFSYPKSYYTFNIFWLNTWLILFFFSYVAIFHLLWIWEGVWI